MPFEDLKALSLVEGLTALPSALRLPSGLSLRAEDRLEESSSKGHARPVTRLRDASGLVMTAGAGFLRHCEERTQ